MGEQPQFILANLETGQEIPVTDTVRIGRAPQNALVLADEKASWFHATLWLQQQQLYVRDEGSTNGTWVAGIRISEPTPLPVGTQLQLGNTVLEAQRQTPTAIPAVKEADPIVRRTSRPWIPFAIVGSVLLLMLGALLIRSEDENSGLLPTVTSSPEAILLTTSVPSPTLASVFPLTPTVDMSSRPNPTSTPPLAPRIPTVGLLYPAPELAEPGDGASHQGTPGPLLSWVSQGTLSGDEYYRLIIDYPHHGQNWREVGWVQTTSWRPPDYLLSLLSGPNDCRWSVQVMQVTEKDAIGNPTAGRPISPSSETWTFVWTEEATSVSNPTSPLPTPDPNPRP